MLIEKGVPADKLVTKGLETKVPWKLDEWSGGKYDEMTAIQNQTVTIISDTSDKYNQVISDFDTDIFK
ncbi:MAG: hypothetical protein LBM93_04835 [Oscillospiraceae bacterium]|jgi:activator of HSP90 ATPase|nr:hypothetical protein [Oscillospiraceae bacterium]